MSKILITGGQGFLGKKTVDGNRKSFSKNIEYASFSYNTHSYLVSNNAVNKICKINIKNKIIPYDEFLSAIAWNSPRTDLNRLYLRDYIFSL